MVDPVNLNRYRKARARVERKAQANENSIKFGRTKAERELEKTRAQKATTKLDQHKLDE